MTSPCCAPEHTPYYSNSCHSTPRAKHKESIWRGRLFLEVARLTLRRFFQCPREIFFYRKMAHLLTIYFWNDPIGLSGVKTGLRTSEHWQPRAKSTKPGNYWNTTWNRHFHTRKWVNLPFAEAPLHRLLRQKKQLLLHHTDCNKRQTAIELICASSGSALPPWVLARNVLLTLKCARLGVN